MLEPRAGQATLRIMIWVYLTIQGILTIALLSDIILIITGRHIDVLGGDYDNESSWQTHVFIGVYVYSAINSCQLVFVILKNRC